MSEKEKPESNIQRNIMIGAGSIIIIFLLVNIVYPIHLIGIIWDWDIKNQLINVNSEAKASDLKTITLRLTYENNADTEIRIEMAIETYQQMYRNENNTHAVYKGDNGTILELSWYVE